MVRSIDYPVENYRKLRMGIVALVVMLAVAVLHDSLRSGKLLDSISAYYFSSAHVIFVASLCAIGACLIVYEGNTDAENVTLNFSGMLAFIVAVVPTKGGESPVAFPCFGYVIEVSVEVGVFAALVAALAALIAWLVVKRYFTAAESETAAQVASDSTNGNMLSRLAERTLTLAGKVPGLDGLLRWAAKRVVGLIRFFGWLLMLVIAALFFLNRTVFLEVAHGISAIAMFLGIVLVVVINAYTSYHRRNSAQVKYFTIYLVIAVSMLLTVGGAFLLAVNGASGTWVFLVEVLLILEFACFWVFQTFDLWNADEDRSAEAPTESLKLSRR